MDKKQAFFMAAFAASAALLISGMVLGLSQTKNSEGYAGAGCDLATMDTLYAKVRDDDDVLSVFIKVCSSVFQCALDTPQSLSNTTAINEMARQLCEITAAIFGFTYETLKQNQAENAAYYIKNDIAQLAAYMLTVIGGVLTAVFGFYALVDCNKKCTAAGNNDAGLFTPRSREGLAQQSQAVALNAA